MAANQFEQVGYHAFNDQITYQFGWTTYKEDTKFEYTFENFFHPFVGELIEKLNKESLKGMLDPEFHQSLVNDFFDHSYTKIASPVVDVHHFPKEIDVRAGGPYANYNWELFFHIPLTIAVHLSKNQRFAEAQKWFHYIFDPTCTDMDIPAPYRYWKFLDFRKEKQIMQIDEMLMLLSKSELTPEESVLRTSVLNSYEAVRNNPFQPHAVARTRHLAYQYSVVMKYLDNLIAWGDSLFRQETVESIQEATGRYILAANLLGPKPQLIPPQGASRPRTFAELKKQGMDELGNALIELEGQFPFNLGLPAGHDEDPESAEPLFGIGRTLYFCVPRNEKMLSYWDQTADRLFKIRHCMNIDGVVRQLALFDPPLDPGMLVKAASAGIPIGSIVSGLNQPVGTMRALPIIQKALELCAEVKSLGSAVLSAIEKGDGERMALLRQGHEINIHQITQDVRFLQWKQAQEATESLLRSRSSALDRYRHYKRLLGIESEDGDIPDVLPLDRGVITEENFDEVLQAFVSQYDQPVSAPEYAPLAVKQEGRLALHAGEYDEMNDHAVRALGARISAAGTEVVTGVLSLIPTFHLNASYWGIGPDAKVGGGDPLSAASKAVSTGLGIWAQIEDSLGQYAVKRASYERRADEWVMQTKQAARELMHIGRQLIGSLLAEQSARQEYVAIRKQLEQSREVDQFLRDKFTNEELYAWMQGECARLYYEYYRFAVDTARKAEQTMKHELMRPEVDNTDYIQFNYWDGGRKGLLSGEALYLDVKRMELAYHENNKREYELTKHVSLRQLDPVALLQLKSTGTCEMVMPEWLFDLDGPGHYLRRIKSVSISIPSVTGPYTSINCTLTLMRSALRKSPLLPGGYAREESEDSRFVDYFGTIQSIVTSNGQNDSGLFETQLRDERFLPFEGAGAESRWKLELPAVFRQFDYDTISDVILHVRYTAREGGAGLRSKAIDHLKECVEAVSASGLAILLNPAHDFPSEWHRFINGGETSDDHGGEMGDEHFRATIKRSYFPYFTQGGEVAIHAIQLCEIKDQQLETLQVQGIDLGALTTQLQDEHRFELSLAPNEILTRDQQSNVFVVIQYRLTI